MNYIEKLIEDIEEFLLEESLENEENVKRLLSLVNTDSDFLEALGEVKLKSMLLDIIGRSENQGLNDYLIDKYGLKDIIDEYLSYEEQVFEFEENSEQKLKEVMSAPEAYVVPGLEEVARKTEPSIEQLNEEIEAINVYEADDNELEKLEELEGILAELIHFEDTLYLDDDMNSEHLAQYNMIHTFINRIKDYIIDIKDEFINEEAIKAEIYEDLAYLPEGIKTEFEDELMVLFDSKNKTI